jgi:hypothetical protein
MFFARVIINGGDAGVYFVKERFSKQWLEKNGFPDNSEVFTQTDEVLPDVPSLKTEIQDYKLWRAAIDEQGASFEGLKTLFNIIEISDDDFFYANIGNILDLDKWYAAIAINVLSGRPHSIRQNLNLLFNPATGKFEPLLEDIGALPDAVELNDPEKIYKKFDMLSKRILSNEILYSEYRKILEKMSAQKNERDFLNFYDSLYSELKPEFYKDQTKYKNDFQVNSEVAEWRSVIEKNYELARALSNLKEFPKNAEPDSALRQNKPTIWLPGSFKYLTDISRRVTGNVIWSGRYSFRENIIIPSNTKLIIKPGTKIYLTEGVSIISYSPIEALGTKENPILIARADPGKNWGAVSVINTDKKSEFNYVTMIGGSSSKEINGVIFTGMISAHNAPLYVRNSNFYQDEDDDAINVKYATGEIEDSKFFNTNQDAIDLDWPKNFIVSGNTFSNIGLEEGGDAIDLSFADNAIISRNEINTCSDKGVSVGEKSQAEIYENSIKNCSIGIAVKDESTAKIYNNIFIANNENISLYVKKPIFGQPEAEIRDNIYK